MSVNRTGQPYVYFLRPVGAEGPVKIGCSERPQRRLEDFMGWSPLKLEIAATINGDEALERRFHHAFRAHHSHREWFHAHPDISRAIEQIKSGAFDLEALPCARGVPVPLRSPWPEWMKERARLGRRIEALRGAGVEIPRELDRYRHVGPEKPLEVQIADVGRLREALAEIEAA